MIRHLSIAAIAMATAGAAFAAPVEVLSPGATWEYTFDTQASTAWTTTTGLTAGWTEGDAPFGNRAGAATSAIRPCGPRTGPEAITS